MSAPFLRGESVTLVALEGPLQLPARLVAPELSAGLDRAFVLGVRDALGALVGSLGLERIDWVERSARLTARGEVPLEALVLVVGYAFRELNLDSVEAVGADAVWADLLREAGFATRAGSWVALRP